MIPVIELEGSPFERGAAHGELLREQIQTFVQSVVAVHLANNTTLRVNRQSLDAFCRRHVGHIENFAPDLLEEMRGIARGSDTSFEDILLLNCFLELEDLRAAGLGGKILADRLWGCTTFNVPRQVSGDGAAYIGQTYDMEKYYEKFLVILRLKNENGVESLIISLAGIIGLSGINSAGIGTAINKITALDARPGVIYPVIMRRALAAERIGDALGTVIFSPRACGINYQLAGDGIAFCAETSATRYQLLDCSRGIAHTNHYVGSEMQSFETPLWLSHGGSMVRKQVADTFLQQHRGTLSPALLKDLMTDHTNHPRCICAHGFPGEGEETAFHTIFGVVMDPAGGWFDICQGNPCSGDFVRHAL